MQDDATLLRRYATEDSGEAFAELVRRHLPLVYAAALRRLGGDTHRAEDVAQTVFCALARHARRLAGHAALAGWLYTATRYAVSDALRAESRRRRREEEAATMQENDEEASADWTQLRPLLDAAMDRLGERDREAVLARYFQGRPFAEVGTLLGVSEEAARKRVERALDKLRALLQPQGVGSSAGALAALLAAHTATAAPAGLAASIAGSAVATGGVAAATGLGGILALGKLQVGLALAVVTGGAAGLVLQQQALSTLREENAAARQESARLAAENAALARRQAETAAALARAPAEAAARPPPTAVPVTSPRPLAAPAAGASATPASTPATPRARAARTYPRPTEAEMHRRYDPFLIRYGLTAAQRDRFVALKLAIYDAQEELQAAMEKEGAPGGTAGVEQLRNQLVGGYWAEIRQLLGPAGSAAYGEYERVSAYSSVVASLEKKFVAVGAPLSDTQAEALARTIADNLDRFRRHPTDLGSSVTIRWDDVVAKSAAFLSAPQLAVLREQTSRSAPPRPATSPN